MPTSTVLNNVTITLGEILSSLRDLLLVKLNTCHFPGLSKTSNRLISI
uniref:Uncharacterized protein n=1 Tax=Nelumbo nucifera TaxID=4432 RepID=A0A822YZC4_NELNU|nr:TPA_asm: hypothetical protein HUJ06_007452 [Nelumbo nucifera]